MTSTRILSAVALIAFGFALGTWSSSIQAQGAGKVFELRTYTAPEGN